MMSSNALGKKSEPSKFSRKEWKSANISTKIIAKNSFMKGTISAEREIYPQAALHAIKLIIGSVLLAIETLLEEGVSQRDLPLHKLYFAKSLVQF
jgi:hypothetical protein